MQTAVLLGEVDHGKSSLTGRMLVELGSLTDVQAKRLGASVVPNFALLLDALGEERHDERTVGLTRITLRRGETSLRVLDAPGHQELMRSLVTGLSLAETVLVTVSAPDGVTATLRRQLSLLRFFAPRRILLVVTKTDLVPSGDAAVRMIFSDVSPLLIELGHTISNTFAVSAHSGEGLEAKALFYKELFEPLPALPRRSLRMWVQGVRDDQLYGTPSQGELTNGEQIYVFGDGRAARVSALRDLAGDAESIAEGMPAMVRLVESSTISRGTLIAAGDLPEIAHSVTLTVQQFEDCPLVAGKTLSLRIGTRLEKATITAAEIGASTETLNIHLSLPGGIPVDRAGSATNRFLLEDAGRAVAIAKCV